MRNKMLDARRMVDNSQNTVSLWPDPGATHLEVPSREGLVEELAEHREEVGTGVGWGGVRSHTPGGPLTGGAGGGAR